MNYKRLEEAPFNGPSVPPPYTVLPQSNELQMECAPPLYTEGNGNFFNCKACHHRNSFDIKDDKLSRQCLQCGEQTAVKIAPPGKMYFRCTCHKLYLVKKDAIKVFCKRATCLKVSKKSIETTPCTSCKKSFEPNTICKTMCVKCRPMDRKLAILLGVVLLVFGVVAAGGGFGLTLGTYYYAQKFGGTYFICAGLFVFALATFFKGLYYLIFGGTAIGCCDKDFLK